MRHINLLLLVLTLFLTPSAFAGSPANSFVDFDGDGINDNITDLDSNGIPDQFQKKVNISAPATNTSLGDFFANMNQGNPENNNIKLPNSDRFVLYQFRTRMLSNCRSDSENQFSSRLAGSGSGGGCVGGVCF